MNQELIDRLPLRLIHNVIVQTRNLHFTVPKPDTKPLYIKRDIEIESILDVMVNEYHFEDGTIPSYKYHGEDLNLRAPWGFDEHGRYMQLHARFFIYEYARTEVLVHYEPSPLQHPDDHYHEEGFSWERGREEFIPIVKELSLM